MRRRLCALSLLLCFVLTACSGSLPPNSPASGPDSTYTNGVSKKDEISTKTIGALKKGKKHVKPGYKRAIKWQIEEDNKKKRRAERNKNARKTRDSRKQSF